MSQDRMRNFKNFGKDTDELRRRRNTESVALRKQRKDEQLAKRRNIDTDEVDATVAVAVAASEPVELSDFVSDGIIQQMVNDISHPDDTMKLRGIQLARKVLSRERHPPIDLVVSSGIVSKCVEFLKMKTNADLQFEAAWVLTNIASGTSAQTEIVVKSGAVGPFIEMLRSPHPHIVEQSCWALGNCIGDGPHIRDGIIAMGVIPPLVALVKTHSDATVMRNLAWTLSNICRGKNPPPPSAATRQCLPALARLISMKDFEIISDSCWALSYVSDGSNEKIQEVINAGVLPRLAELLDLPNLTIVTPALRTLGNVVTGSDAQTEAVVKTGVIPTLTKLLRSHKPTIVKEAAWTLSNIAAGTMEQISAIMDSGVIPLVFHVIENGEFRAQKEAIWIITNITTGGSVQHMITLCQYGVVPILCGCLSIKDWRTVIIVLEAIENILKAADQFGQLDRVSFLVEECGGLDKIEQLQSHENTTIYNKAYSIIESYFNTEETDDHNLLPVQDSAGDFEMNIQTPEGGFNL